MFKEACQNVERPLNAGALGRRGEAIIGIEKRREGPNCSSQALLSDSLLGVSQYCHPVTDDSVNNQV